MDTKRQSVPHVLPEKNSCQDRDRRRGAWQLECPVERHYVDPYIQLESIAFKVNLDIVPLATGVGTSQCWSPLRDCICSDRVYLTCLDNAYYTVIYAVKMQVVIENRGVFHLHAFDKAIACYNSAKNASVKESKVITSIISSLSNPQEVAAPMASLFVLHDYRVYSYHVF